MILQTPLHFKSHERVVHPTLGCGSVLACSHTAVMVLFDGASTSRVLRLLEIQRQTESPIHPSVHESLPYGHA